MVSNLPFGSGVINSRAPQAHQIHVSTLSGRSISPYPASYAGAADGGRSYSTRFPGSFRPPAFACWIFLRPLRIGLPYGRRTRRFGRPDLIGVVVFRMSEMRPGWLSSEPRGRRCAPGWRARAQPAPAALLRPVPTTRWCFPSAGACMTRHHRGFTCIHPSGLPRPVTPGWDEGPWAFDLRLRTPRLPATHAEAGTGPAHWPGKIGRAHV